MPISLVKSARELPEYAPVLGNLIARDLKVKYQSAGLGFAWSLLHPAILLAIWYLVFNRAGLLKDSMPRYWAYLLSGMLAFQFIQTGILEGAAAVRRNAGIIRKVYLPIEILVIAAVTVKLVEFLLQLVVAIALLSLFHRTGTAQFSLTKSIIVLPGAIGLTYLFVLGVSLPLAAWTVIYRDLEHILSLSLYALFFLSPVFWSVSMIATADHFGLVALNPIASLLNLFHGPLYWGRYPANLAVAGGAIGAWTLAAAFVAIVLIMGYALFDRAKHVLAEVV
ncbi:MAG: ABC transporter permease [Gemmatimonadaceae bacterium]|nr:ABC transporter permease [Gemmatimonadaceae bacterium]